MAKVSRQGALLEAILKQADAYPQKQAIEGKSYSLSYAELLEQVRDVADWLDQYEQEVIGLLLENSPAWVVIDLAVQMAGKVVVPLPHFFSDEQLKHVIDDASIGLLLTDNSERLKAFAKGSFESSEIVSKPDLIQAESISLYQNHTLMARSADLSDVGKITYTSGTTGEPKGVCLSNESIFEVTEALKVRTGASADDCHLCLTPLSTLLENSAGIYVPLLAGGKVVVLPSSEVGLKGASGLDVKQLLAALNGYHASSAILIPQMLLAMVTAIEKGLPRPDKLRFLAVGGAPVSENLLARAAVCGLPVFQGYGLSECASVVAVNSPIENRLGSVGKPLPHLQIRFSKEGEILLKGSLFKGYLGSAEIEREVFWPTGDIGYEDEAGYLWVTGRKKSLFITSYGRNVSPEWLESEFSAHPAIQQIVVFGEGRAWNCAVIVSQLLATVAGRSEIDQIIETINARLPDYARIKRWLPAKAPFSLENGQWTGTARPRRVQIFEAHQDEIEQLYLREEIK
jgi:long-subunit acyl-CoA synthetase (AMP-forming)